MQSSKYPVYGLDDAAVIYIYATSEHLYISLCLTGRSHDDRPKNLTVNVCGQKMR
jgi:hypothetical protein